MRTTRGKTVYLDEQARQTDDVIRLSLSDGGIVKSIVVRGTERSPGDGEMVYYYPQGNLYHPHGPNPEARKGLRDLLVKHNNDVAKALNECSEQKLFAGHGYSRRTRLHLFIHAPEGFRWERPITSKTAFAPIPV